ncbi:hypothetical protein I4U23_001250 [Adineta vaga]|nr:hypothetical protein I4U23_001250 [Adineta vaga]
MKLVVHTYELSLDSYSFLDLNQQCALCRKNCFALLFLRFSLHNQAMYESRKHMMLKMLHPTSGRQNFCLVPEKPTTEKKDDQGLNPLEIETKTKDAINTVAQSQSISDTTTSEKN